MSGAIDNDCDGESGQCLCEKNWTGFNCNECKKGYYKQASKALKNFFLLDEIQKKTFQKYGKFFSMTTLENFTMHEPFSSSKE